MEAEEVDGQIVNEKEVAKTDDVIFATALIGFGLFCLARHQRRTWRLLREMKGDLRLLTEFSAASTGYTHGQLEAIAFTLGRVIKENK